MSSQVQQDAAALKAEVRGQLWKDNLRDYGLLGSLLIIVAFFYIITADHASVAPKCDGDDADPSAHQAVSAAPKSAERFCTATRSAGNNTLTARYWDADKTIVLFMTKAPAAATCDDLGPNKVLKTWDVPAVNGQSVKRTRCELSGTLSGMQAVVSAAVNAPVYVFSPSYLEKDPALKKIANE